MALHVKTPKDQDLRVTEQPREGSRDRGYQGTKAGGGGTAPNTGSPFTLLLTVRQASGQRREMGCLVLLLLKNLAL